MTQIEWGPTGASSLAWVVGLRKKEKVPTILHDIGNRREMSKCNADMENSPILKDQMPKRLQKEKTISIESQGGWGGRAKRCGRQTGLPKKNKKNGRSARVLLTARSEKAWNGHQTQEVHSRKRRQNDKDRYRWSA